MRKLTVGTVLDSLFCIAEIPAASIPQCVQGAVTEQTVKILRICALMAGKIFAFFMTEVRIFFVFPIWFLHNTSQKRGSDAVPE